MNKKFFAGIFGMFITLSMLVGCENSNSTGGVDSEGRDVLTGIILKHPLTQPNSEMQWLQEAEERAGVSIEWEEISADWGQIKGTLLASGDIPDLIIGAGALSNSDYAQFTGLFEDLADHMDLLPNVQKMFDEQPGTKQIATQLDGSIYGLSKYQRFWPETATRQYINQQWLDELGLDVPTTWDELFDVLVAFRDNDANGNGDLNDEIPMDFTGGFGFFSSMPLLGSTGITITNANGQGYFAEGGVVKNYLVDERYKELVQFLHKCFAEGLINQEVFTQDYTRYQSLARGDGDIAKVGFTFGWVSTDRFGDQLAPQYTSIAPLQVNAESTVDVSWMYDNLTLNYAANVVSLSANSSNKEAALAFVNELYDPVVSMQILFGSLDTNIQDNGDGTFKILPPLEEGMDQGTWKWTSTWADNGPMYISDDLELELGPDMQLALDETVPLEGAFSNIDLDNDILPTMFMKYTNEEIDTLAINNTNFMSIAESNFARWITSGGIEEEWESYIVELDRAGLGESLEIMQRNYDEFIK